MKKQYFTIIKSKFPDFAEDSLERLSENLISPYRLELPIKVLQQAEAIVKTLYQLRENEIYQSQINQICPLISKFDPGNKSICMSYDFHIDELGNLKLIEVNTNAAFLMMGYFLYESHSLVHPIQNFNLDEFRKNILEEIHLNHNKINPNSTISIAIVDDEPSKQKLFFEFLLYEQVLKQLGFNVCIVDPSELQWQNNQLIAKGVKIDFIYNRTTDFYLEQNAHENFKKAYLERFLTLSPNPHEYSLLADKQRLIEWSHWCRDISSPFYEQLSPIANFLLESTFLSESNSSDIWSKKKKYFFKPLSSFGSKGTFRGEGISRVYFDQLINSSTLAQEYCPAKESEFSAPDFPTTKLKYDLRFYAYKDKIQMVIARLYQGQVTNLKTTYGGFAPVKFIV